MKPKEFEDSEFGTITIVQRSSARHIIFRVRQGRIFITIPPGFSISSLTRHIEENRKCIKKLLEKKRPLLQVGDIIVAHDFTIHIVGHDNSEEVRFSLDNRLLTVSCPVYIPAEDSLLQQSLKKGICRFLHESALAFLPQRAEAISRQLNVEYASLSISHGRQRLGKCDVRRNITLSYYLMLMPDRLIDYVICHELAHLKEMNHGAGFHEICNRYCNGNEKILEKELKRFPFPFD